MMCCWAELSQRLFSQLASCFWAFISARPVLRPLMERRLRSWCWWCGSTIRDKFSFWAPNSPECSLIATARNPSGRQVKRGDHAVHTALWEDRKTLSMEIRGSHTEDQILV